jgi:hypothetical protein
VVEFVTFAFVLADLPGSFSDLPAASSHALQLISVSACGSILNGGGASAGHRSARSFAALPTRWGAPNCDASSASAIGATFGLISGLPLPLTTWK